MENLVKIAEVIAESEKSAEVIAETLVGSGFRIAVHEDETLKYCFDILLRSE